MTVSAPPVPGADVRSTYDALAPFYDRFTADHDYELWTRELEGLARRHGARGRRLLDLACGTGKSFAPFLGRGYRVTACDISPEMLRVAATRAGDAVRLLERDIRRLDRLGAFDLVCCLDDALNYVTDSDELELVFAGIRRNLAPGGVALFDLNTLWCYRTFFASSAVVEDDSLVLTWHGRADASFGAGELAEAGLSAFVDAGGGVWRRTETVHRQRHHPRAVVAEALERAGLAVLGVFGQDTGGRIQGALDDDAHSKAVYLACAREHA
ncbi:MAG: Methyltransferase type 11 [Solirubrobacterales bacterium]|nr:Methyltransferase type 11 [Solirubrobacterales bacterium]